jgi:hypothetical protein
VDRGAGPARHIGTGQPTGTVTSGTVTSALATTCRGPAAWVRPTAWRGATLRGDATTARRRAPTARRRAATAARCHASAAGADTATTSTRCRASAAGATASTGRVGATTTAPAARGTVACWLRIAAPAVRCSWRHAAAPAFGGERPAAHAAPAPA